MPKMLLRDELNEVELAQLANMTLHPGYLILKRMMSEHCKICTEMVIKLDPATEDYDRKLKNLQITARAVNDFSSSVLASVEVLRGASIQQQKEEERITEVMDRIKRLQKEIQQEQEVVQQ